MTLVWDIGQSLEVHDLDATLIRAAIDLLRKRTLGDRIPSSRVPVAG